MVRRGYGRAVNVSSGGSFGEGIGPVANGASEVAQNALTVKVAEAARGDVKANATCPGWVRTDMGGASAPGARSRPRTPSSGSRRCLPTAPTAASFGIASPSPGEADRGRPAGYLFAR